MLQITAFPEVPHIFDPSGQIVLKSYWERKLVGVGKPFDQHSRLVNYFCNHLLARFH